MVEHLSEFIKEHLKIKKIKIKIKGFQEGIEKVFFVFSDLNTRQTILEQ